MNEPELKVSKSTLLPCAHCGGEAEFDNASYDDANGYHPRFTVECSNMECDVFFDSKELAANAWNRRQPCDKCDRIEKWMDNVGSTPVKAARYEMLLKFVKDIATDKFCACVSAEIQCWFCSARELLKEINDE